MHWQVRMPACSAHEGRACVKKPCRYCMAAKATATTSAIRRLRPRRCSSVRVRSRPVHSIVISPTASHQPTASHKLRHIVLSKVDRTNLTCSCSVIFPLTKKRSALWLLKKRSA